MTTKNYKPQIQLAITHFWNTRNRQKDSTKSSNRSAVTGGKQLDGFLELLSVVAIDMGIPKECIYLKGNHISGYFRPTKDWDLLIISPNNKLIAVIELKSQVGSFGNNFNNRTEEALGSAVDFWTAYRENAYPEQSAPWLGYLMLVEKSEKSTKPVRVSEPHFKVLPEFIGCSYLERYKILCQKLMLERHYSQSCLLWSQDNGSYSSLSDEISIETFIQSFQGHLIGQLREFK
ncbi:MAG: PaeR7I family type II restriction endonuclease [Campylobacterota bacterium]|nr:PaeR7I family type II restriction endonuclease [Campylobacterota bacterium]